jgi:phosphate/sulfate permease
MRLPRASWGFGCAKRFSALKLGVIERIVWAWILTIPAQQAWRNALVQELVRNRWISYAAH